MIERLSLTVARLFLALWVGGAALFVITSIAEQRHPGFMAATKNELALLRFPWYYRFGFTLVAATLVCGHLARNHRELRGAKRYLVVGGLGSAFALMLVDYYFVYRPLQEMLSTAEQVIPAGFQRLHEASKWLNFADVGLCAVAAIALCWPSAEPSNS